MFFMHPFCLGISFFGAFGYSFYLKGKKTLIFQIKYMVPVLIFTAVINPMINHQGATILTYIGENGNPLTLESVCYGISSASMLITVICWFSCYHCIMTSDKFVYLFGQIFPSLSLVFSMILRFVPKFKTQFQVVSNAQRYMGCHASNKGWYSRIKQEVKVISIMITWMLENAIETADSMKSRGYGLKGRTAFSLYVISRRDGILLVTIIVLTLGISMGNFFGLLYFRYFPTIHGVKLSIISVSQFLLYALLCFMPLVVNLWEDSKWKLLY